jgi:phage repressor protein C with HTH and peptisase S24 domain
MEDGMDIVAWIRRGLGKPGKSQRGLADALGIDPAGVTRLLKGERQLKATEIAKVARYLGEAVPMPPVRGALSGGAVAREGTSGIGSAAAADDAYARVAVYDARAAAGAGAVGSDTIKHFLVFREQWLRQVTNAPLDELAVIEVDGDSMEPTLRSGDHALIDRTERRPRQKDGLYVLLVDGGLQVKRVSAHPVSGLLTVSSDNTSYRSYTDISPADVDVVGRVIWIGRRM